RRSRFQQLCHQLPGHPAYARGALLVGQDPGGARRLRACGVGLHRRNPRLAEDRLGARRRRRIGALAGSAQEARRRVRDPDRAASPLSQGVGLRDRPGRQPASAGEVRLAEAAAPAEAWLEQRVGQILDRRLRRDLPQPLAVALSGGGDSLALLLIAARWAKAAGRELVVLTVDHGLQAKSADWTRACAATAQRLGLPFRGLVWTGEKPATGLPAAARAARHALLADAARASGARVILMGHTA